MTPAATKALSVLRSRTHGSRMTVKLDNVVPHTLQIGPSAGSLLEHTHRLSLASVYPQDSKHRGSDDRGEDGKASECPLPRAVSEEALGRRGSRKSRRYVRRRREREGQCSVLQRGRVCHDDVEDVR
jgi:hypothetical protein